jgi:hypothetical protein
MVYKPVKKKMTNLKNRPKHYQEDKKKWKLKVKQNNKVVKEGIYGSLGSLEEDMKSVNKYTIRNIAYGRVPNTIDGKTYLISKL